MEKQTKTFSDIGYTVVAEPGAAHVNYTVYRISHTDDDGTIYYEVHNEMVIDYTDNVDDADVYLSGSVKFDGCSNWSFDEQERVMLHGCSRLDLVNIGEIMARCWDWTAELLDYWIGYAE